MARRKQSLWQRIGPDAIVTMLIAVVAVGAAQVVFQTHTRDIEESHRLEFLELKQRLIKIERVMQRRIVVEARTETRLNYIEGRAAARP